MFPITDSASFWQSTLAYLAYKHCFRHLQAPSDSATSTMDPLRTCGALYRISTHAPEAHSAWELTGLLCLTCINCRHHHLGFCRVHLQSLSLQCCTLCSHLYHQLLLTLSHQKSYQVICIKQLPATEDPRSLASLDKTSITMMKLEKWTQH